MPAGRFRVSKNPLKGLVSKPPKTYQEYLRRKKKRSLVGTDMTKAQFEYRSTHAPKASGGKDQGPRFLGIPVYSDEVLHRGQRLKKRRLPAKRGERLMRRPL